MVTPTYTFRLSQHALELDADGHHDLDDLTDVDLTTPPTLDDVLTWDGTSWVAAAPTGGGAPTTADYLVGTAQGGLSAEIVVGATPGGELGGTWAAPTVDATHSGSTHSASTDTHIADATAAHAATAISFTPTGTIAATDVQAAIAEVASEAAGGHTEDHDHDGAPTQKLAQANTHESPDTDAGPTSLHHTLGTGANQAAAGDHGHLAHAAHAARVKRSASVSVGNNTFTPIPFTAEDYDTDAIHDNSTDNTRLIIPSIAGVTTGLWSVKASGYTNASSGRADVVFRVNAAGNPASGTLIGGDLPAANASGISPYRLVVDWVFTAGDYVECFVRTTGGTFSAIFDAGMSPIFEVAFLGKVT